MLSRQVMQQLLKRLGPLLNEEDAAATAANEGDAADETPAVEGQQQMQRQRQQK